MTQASRLSFHGFPASGEVIDITSFHLKVEKGEHPWVKSQSNAIAANWTQELAANPALFDGRIVLQHQVTHAGGHLEGLAYVAPYSALLHWRRNGRPPGVMHLFAMPLIASADGAVLAIRMGADTANPGQVYCAAGSLDLQDVVAGRCELDANMARELGEETSLLLGDGQAVSGYKAVMINNTVSVFRLFRYAQPAEELARRIKQHVSADPDPEIEGPVIIRDGDPHRHDYAFFMPAILNWFFAEGRK